jgi:hypothetical protein
LFTGKESNKATNTAPTASDAYFATVSRELPACTNHPRLQKPQWQKQLAITLDVVQTRRGQWHIDEAEHSAAAYAAAQV